MVVNKTTFAEMAGVSKAMISTGIKRGVLEQTAQGYIDTGAPKNMIYLAHRKEKGGTPAVIGVRKRKPKKEKAPTIQAPKNEAAPPLDGIGGIDLEAATGEGEADGLDGVFDNLDKLSADIRLKTIQAKRHELKFEQDKGHLVSFEMVERMIGRANGEIKTRVQDLPRRITPRVVAMARSGASETDIQIVFQREIDDALDAIVAALSVGAPSA